MSVAELSLMLSQMNNERQLLQACAVFIYKDWSLVIGQQGCKLK